MVKRVLRRCRLTRTLNEDESYKNGKVREKRKHEREKTKIEELEKV